MKKKALMTLQVHATPEEVMRAVDALREFGHTHGIHEDTLFGLTLALEECGSNIVNHALRRDPAQSFQVSFEHTGNAVTIELRDHGPTFDPTQHQVTKPETNLEEQRPGGWGIPLVRRYMDEIRYTRESGQNVLRLTKQLAGQPAQT
jgi:anti-sigma regulatory factor (Ser/Thr protein kinase)